MQNLGAEIGELGRLGEGDRLHAVRFGHELRIAGHHAINVGPNLNLLRSQSGADNGGAEIGAAAAQRGGHAIFGRADESAEHRHSFRLDQRRNLIPNAGVSLRVYGRGGFMAAIGKDDAARIHMRRIHSQIRKDQGNQLARQALAIARERIGGSG